MFYGWVIIFLAFLTLGITFGVWYSFSVFFLAVINEFGWSRASTSSIFSIFIISQSLMGLVTGHLQDRFGPRVVIPLGAVVLTMSLLMTSFTQSLWYYRISYGIFAGVGTSLLGFSSHSAFLPNWFERKRGLALGIAMAGIGFGMLFIVPITEKLINIYGWRNSYLLLACIVLLFITPFNLIFSRHKPEDLNLRADGNGSESISNGVKSSMIVEIVDHKWNGEDWTFNKAVRQKRFWFMVLAFSCASYCVQSVLLHSIPRMVDAGLTTTAAACYFGILGISGSCGKILFGHLSDRMGRELANTIACTFAVSGVLCLMSVGIPGHIMPLLFSIFFGLGYGAVAPLFPSISADLFLGKEFGVIFAMICIGGGAGGSLGPFVSGFLHDYSGSYSISFELSSVILIISCIFIWVASPSGVRKIVRNIPPT